MIKKPFEVNEMLPAMTSQADIEWLAAQLMRRVRGELESAQGRAPLRVITYASYCVENDSVVITDGAKFGPMCVYAAYQSSQALVTYELPLKVCENVDVADRLARELRTLVYGRERLAGRMRSRDV